LVVAAFSEQQTEAARAALERLKPLLDDRKALQHEAAQLGYTVVWEGETAMLFPQSLTTASRASRALQFLEAFHEDLKRLGYRAGQPIAGDALSEATLVALANLLGTPPDSALMRELRDGTRAIALDVVVAPRLRDGSPVVFSDIKNIPTLSRLEPNATAVGRAADQLRQRWKQNPQLLEPNAMQPSRPDDRQLSQWMQQANLDVGRADSMRLYFSRVLELEAVEQQTQRYLKRLNQMRQETLRRVQAAEWEVVRLLLHEAADALPQDFARPIPLAELPPALQQLIQNALADAALSEAIVLSPDDFVPQLSIIKPIAAPRLSGETDIMLDTLAGISLYPSSSRRIYVRGNR